MHLHRRLVLVGKSIVNAARPLRSVAATKGECDVLMIFPCQTDDTTLMWMLSCMRARAPHLHVAVHSHGCHEPASAFYVTASYPSLLTCAEELGFKKKLKPQFGGQMTAFYYAEQQCYEGADDEAMFFTSLERQTLVYHMINCIRAEEGETLREVSFIEGQAIVPELVAREIIKQILPLHNVDGLQRLQAEWVFAFSNNQPMEQIKDYFGSHIGMYFSYLGHYTWSLCFPAVVGAAVWMFSGISQSSDDLISVAFALFNVLWSTVYIELWKRKSTELAYAWGTLDRKDDLIAEPRPLFHGQPVISPVTGRKEPYYPAWKRNVFFYSVSMPVITLSLMVIFAISLAFLTLYGYVAAQVAKGQLFYPCKFVPMTMLGLAVCGIDRVYGRIAVWLTTKENYRLEEEYRNQLTIKLTLFQSMNAFMSLFYTAFYLQDFERLRYQLGTLLIVRQIISNTKESLMPFAVAQFKQHKNTKDALVHVTHSEFESNSVSSAGAASQESKARCAALDEGSGSAELPSQSSQRLVLQAELESYKPRYEGTFDDYLEMVIQFGYVTWFSGVFPLAGLCALANNFVEIRSDAFKLCMSFQRPFGELARDIGAWEWVLEGMSMAALVVNAALIGVSGQVHRLLPDLTAVHTLLLIVALEHLVMAIKFYIHVAVSDAPEWVQVEMARLEFSRREALKKVQSHPLLTTAEASSQLESHRTRHVSESAVDTIRLSSHDADRLAYDDM